MIEQTIQAVLDAIAAKFDAFFGIFTSIYYFFTDPFIPVVLGAAGIVLAAAVVRWFFGSAVGIWPGVVAALAAGYAWVFRKGQRAEQDRRRRKG